MTNLTTPTLVMVLVLSRGDQRGRGNHAHLVAQLDEEDDETFSLWKTTPKDGEDLDDAALRCLKELLRHPEVQDAISQRHNISDLGDILTDTHRIKVYYLHWLIPQQDLKADNLAFIDLQNGVSMLRMDENSSAVLEAVPPTLPKRIH